MNSASVSPMSPENQPIPDETANMIHVRDLRLEHVALSLAPVLYRAARVWWPDHPDYPEDFKQAPQWVRDRIIKLARRDLMAVNDAHEREADRQAELAFMRTFDEAVMTAKDLDRDHSRFDLVEDAFDRLRGLLHQVKPARIMLSIYRTALTKGGAR
jgi:hypothetical protein